MKLVRMMVRGAPRSAGIRLLKQKVVVLQRKALYRTGEIDRVTTNFCDAPETGESSITLKALGITQ